MHDVKPFLIPQPALVSASPWQRLADDDWDDLGAHVDDWDYRTQLRLRCLLRGDIAGIRAQTRLDDGTPLAWSIGWRATDTGLVGTPVVRDVTGIPTSIELHLPPERAGATVALTRRLIVGRDRLHARPGEARWAGSILWSDEFPVRLTGRGAAFPTEVVDFSAIGRDPRASWYLDLPSSPDLPAMGAMLLLINAADTALVEAVTRSRRRTELQESMIQHLEEGVVEELVGWALAHWAELDEADTETVGAAARSLTRRVLNDPSTWAQADGDSMELRSRIAGGARRIGFGRSLS